jgi:hypothetical protein
VQDFNSALTTNGLIDGGVIYFGHAGHITNSTGTYRALFVGQDPLPNENLYSGNVNLLSNAKLGTSAAITLNACDTAITDAGQGPPIAQVISSQLGRDVYGYAVGMYFSSYNAVGDPLRTGAGKTAPSDLPVYMVPEGPPGNKPNPLACTSQGCVKQWFESDDMKRLVIALIASSVIGATAQSPIGSGLSAKDVVDQFVKMDVEGERLTTEGWHQADALFVKPSEPPHAKVVLVIARRYAVSEATEKRKKANTAEFYMGYEEVGRIDTTSLRLAPSNSGSETRSFDKYTVVLGDFNHASETPNATRQEGNASPEWRIDATQPPTMHLTAAAAMRYVTQMRAKTADAAIQKNADRTIKSLAPFR